MKKIITIAVSLIALVAILLFYSEPTKNNAKTQDKTNTAENKFEILNAKADGFDNLEELENGSLIIVSGIKEKDIKTEIFRSEINGNVNAGYTLSDFKIESVHKNDVKDSKIKVDSNITILESAFKDKETNKIYSVNGYKNMNNKGKYLLFLQPENDGSYATRGVTYGKVPLETTDLELYSDSESNNLDKIFNKAKQKY
ncbi:MULTISPECIES: hypothetical protein [Clostridia]|uniref:hypothetical protein n=1 Tax=Clostridia TaxID=186801 RepID=UPI000EA25E03|nr:MULTISPECIES: hypothetical protein [Clostridia]NBJ70892.1 hypothetical protein [Roseburia sp. 1XD42-34]RKI75628.1 hypothetical protein D7V87_15625 [Clostridium sp. 1xD42-85]